METRYFVIDVTAFNPIKISTCWALQNDCQNLSFVKDKHTYGKKMARKGRTKVIYKGTFISKQSLLIIVAYIFREKKFLNVLLKLSKWLIGG